MENSIKDWEGNENILFLVSCKYMWGYVLFLIILLYIKHKLKIFIASHRAIAKKTKQRCSIKSQVEIKFFKFKTEKEGKWKKEITVGIRRKQGGSW